MYAYDQFLNRDTVIEKKPFVTQAIGFWACQPKEAFWGGLMYYPSPWLIKLLDETKSLFSGVPEKPKTRFVSHQSASIFLQHAYFCRMYLYMAKWDFVEFFLNQLENIKKTSLEKLETSYLHLIYHMVIRSPKLNREINKLNECLKNYVIDYKDFRSTSLCFHVFLKLIAYENRLNSSEKISYFSEQAQFCIDAFPKDSEHLMYVNLASARLTRQLGLKEIQNKNWEKAKCFLDLSLNVVDEYLSSKFLSISESFLLYETKLRIVEAYYKFFCLRHEKQKALETIENVRKIDPVCPYLGIKHARTLVALGRIDEAKILLHQIEPFAVLEREYIHYLLLRMTSCNLKTLDLSLFWRKKSFFYKSHLKTFELKCDESFRKDNVFKMNLEENIINASEIIPLKLKLFPPTAPDYLQLIGSEMEERTLYSNILKESLIYLRHSSYWTLEAPSFPSPYLNYIPSVAFSVYQQTPAPWFETLFLQRSHVAGFRKELLLSSHSQLFWQKEIMTREECFDTFTHFSPHIESLRHAYSNVMDLSLLQRSYLGRVLGSLGFLKEAVAITAKSPSEGKVLEKNYLSYTHIYLSFLNSKSSGLDQKLRIILNQLPHNIEASRLCLNCTILGSIIAGREKDRYNSRFWRKKALNTLSIILNANEFSDIEKQLLISRTYRAISYDSLLHDDKETLLEDALKCEEGAQSALNLTNTLKNLSEKTVLIVRENLYPTLETLSRIHAVLGNKEKSVKLMSKLCYEIDGLDPKTHLQMGDLLQQEDLLIEAHKHFLIAANLGGTYVAISWFRAGIISEKMGDLEGAQRYFLNSWRSNPMGISPLKKLVMINKDKNSLIRNWALHLLGNLYKLQKV